MRKVPVVLLLLVHTSVAAGPIRYILGRGGYGG
jgi:hypothetical protein